MSTKDWKNKEIKSLLTEAWGFKMNLNKLTEGSDEKLEEEEELEEECPGHDMEMGDETAVALEPAGDDVEALAAKAMAAISDLVAAAGGTMDTTVETGDEEMAPMMEDEEVVDERRARGRKGPHTRGTEDSRLRPEQRVRTMIRQAVKEAVKARAKKG